MKEKKKNNSGNKNLGGISKAQKLLKGMDSAKLADNVFIHIAVWFIVLGVPMFFMSRDNVSWASIFTFIPVALCFIVVFYANYLYLIDKLLFENKKNEFILINIILIIGIAFFMHFWHDFSETMKPFADNPSLGKGEGMQPPPRRPRDHNGPFSPSIFFMLRDVFSLSMVMALCVAIKMSLRWAKIETQQKEMQQTMMEAELKNLKNQINPHFLLNTLNNIYALAQFNSPKLQPAILDLSRLLQYVLYENNQPFVSLKEEANFIRNYIDLMRLRLSDNVNLSVEINLRENSATLIAPLIFISLIENAFKHGVSGEENSFIDISLSENEDGKVEFLCKNSFFPKGESDKSGSGIGLQQVQKRLDLLYPYRYMWHKEIDENVYSTVLIIDTKTEKPKE